MYDGVVSLDLVTRILGKVPSVRSTAGRECPVVDGGSSLPDIPVQVVPVECSLFFFLIVPFLAFGCFI